MDSVLSCQLKHLNRDFNPDIETSTDPFRRMYDKWAPDYEKEVLYNLSCKVYKPMADTFNAAVLKAFPHKRKEEIKIIDVAAGTGLVGVELFKLGFTRIDALDSSQGMLNEAE